MPNGRSGFGYGSRAQDVAQGLDLSGVRIVITGASSGLGLVSARVFADAGATVAVCVRTLERAQAVADSLPGDIRPIELELESPASILRAADSIRSELGQVDVLLLNAGVMAIPQLRLIHGFEAQFYINHLAHMLLTDELLPHLSDTARVVSVASEAHHYAIRKGIDFNNLDGRSGYHPWVFYGQSKLANILYSRALHGQFADSSRVALSLHPGVIDTPLGRHMGPIARGIYAVANPLFFKSAEQGAATQVFASVHPDAASMSGGYLKDCNLARANFRARDNDVRDRLWDESSAWIAELRTKA